MSCGRLIVFVIIVAISSISNAVKVNMHGTLSFGKDVINMIKQYLRQSSLNGRRSVSYDSPKEKSIYTTIHSANLCRNLDFCQNEFKMFILQYVSMLVKVVYNVFDKSLYAHTNEEVKSTIDVPFHKKITQKLKHCFKEIKQILRTANDKITDENETYIWTDIVKKICANIQESAILFVTDKLNGSSKDNTHESRKKLTQQLVIETIIVEEEFRTRLCTEHKICSKSNECTKALNTLMTAFKTMNNDKVKAFVRTFYEVLPDTTFYSKLSEMTVNEFQIVLNDMAFSDNVPTKDVLLIIQNTVEDRLNSSASNHHLAIGRDVELVHVILSDMDHIYSNNKAEPFYKYLGRFYDWTKTGGRLHPIIRQIMNDISRQISLQSDVLILKLINEVRVFLEITIDPEA